MGQLLPISALHIIQRCISLQKQDGKAWHAVVSATVYDCLL